jgi:hypothetical protein
LGADHRALSVIDPDLENPDDERGDHHRLSVGGVRPQADISSS